MENRQGEGESLLPGFIPKKNEEEKEKRDRKKEKDREVHIEIPLGDPSNARDDDKNNKDNPDIDFEVNFELKDDKEDV